MDVSGRPFLVFQGDFPQERVGDFDTCWAEEFFRAFATNAGITLHLRCEYGKNSHHMIEALFKAAAHALKDALSQEGDGDVLLSPKACCSPNRPASRFRPSAEAPWPAPRPRAGPAPPRRRRAAGQLRSKK